MAKDHRNVSKRREYAHDPKLITLTYFRWPEDLISDHENTQESMRHCQVSDYWVLLQFQKDFWWCNWWRVCPVDVYGCAPIWSRGIVF